MTTHLVYLLGGASLLVAVVLPYALRTAALSPPVVLLGLGALIGLLPGTDDSTFSPIEHRVFVEHLAEFTVLVALMGVGLALDRPLSLRSFESWRSWGATWRLLIIAMPLSIAGIALLGWWVMGLAPSAALLLGAALAPTDPVLASDVQVEGPTTTEEDEDEIDEDDEVRFALTSEAGLNDGLAFPFVQAAILLAATGPFAEWGVRWFAWDLAGKVLLGGAIGVVVGWALAKVAFRSHQASLRTADSGEPLLALAAVLLAYGLTEVADGYGFLAVFACAMTMRSAERGHDYHALMHDVIERLERLLTLIVLLLLGVALTNGLLAGLTWQAALVAVLLLFVVRPASGMIALFAGRRSNLRVGDNTLKPRERAATAFFGVRGVGSIYYLAYASGHADFADLPLLWSTVGLAITLSVILHGVTATPAMRWLEAQRDDAET